MKYYSRTRIIFSLIAGFLLFFTVGISTEDMGNSLIAGVALLGVVLPKIWWNFVLDRIHEIAKAIRKNDEL